MAEEFRMLVTDVRLAGDAMAHNGSAQVKAASRNGMVAFSKNSELTNLSGSLHACPIQLALIQHN